MAETSSDPPSPSSPEPSPDPAAAPASDAPTAELQRRASKRKSSLKKEEAVTTATTPAEEEGGGVGGATAEATAAPAPPAAAAAAAGGGGGAEGEAEGEAGTTAGAVSGEAAGAATKAQEKRASRKKSSLKKRPSRGASVVKKEGGGEADRFDEDSEEEEEEVPKIIYPIDPKIQETLRKSWALFIKKGQKKKTEIAEVDIPTVMRSIAINPTETQVKELIAYTRSQDVPTTSKGFLTYECFEQRMAEGFQLDPDRYARHSKEKLAAALYTISGGAKEMHAADFKRIMMTKGDAMTEQEAALMVRNVGDRDTGKVYVEEYADLLSKDGIPQPPPDPTVW